MTIELFIIMLTVGGTLSSLITQALKKAFDELSSNVIAIADAAIVGIGGMIIAYILMDIPFSLQNVVCIPLMAVCIAVGSMVGYDKVIQTLKQIRGV